MSFVKKGNAQMFLFINALLWGSSYVWSKMLLGYLPRFSILFLCSLGGLTATFILFYPKIRTMGRSAILPSLITSSFSIISNTFFMFALQYTSSSNTAFIVQMSVIITPIIMSVLEKHIPERKAAISAVAAAIGMFLLTCDFRNFRLNPGDLLALGNALFFSMFLASQKVCSKKVDPVHFTFIHQAANTLAFLGMTAAFEFRLVDTAGLKNPVFVLLITASMLIAVTTVLIQSSAIRFVRPEKATIIYTLEPVTALLLAALTMGERLGGLLPVIGCVMILLSVLYSVYRPKAVRKKLNLEPSSKPVLE